MPDYLAWTGSWSSELLTQEQQADLDKASYEAYESVSYALATEGLE